MTPPKPRPMQSERYFRRMEPFILRAALRGSYWLPLEELGGISPESFAKYFREAKRGFRHYTGELQRLPSLKHLIALAQPHGVHIRNKYKTAATVPEPVNPVSDEITMSWTFEQGRINEVLRAGAANPVDVFYSKSYRIQCTTPEELQTALDYVRTNGAADAVADKEKLLILLA